MFTEVGKMFLSKLALAISIIPLQKIDSQAPLSVWIAQNLIVEQRIARPLEPLRGQRVFRTVFAISCEPRVG